MWVQKLILLALYLRALDFIYFGDIPKNDTDNPACMPISVYCILAKYGLMAAHAAIAFTTTRFSQLRRDYCDCFDRAGNSLDSKFLVAVPYLVGVLTHAISVFYPICYSCVGHYMPYLALSPFFLMALLWTYMRNIAQQTTRAKDPPAPNAAKT